MPEVDLERYRLPSALHQQIFQAEIVPERLEPVAPQAHPVVVFIGGQPGAGKTATTEMINHTMGLRGPVAHVCGDFYKPYHPDYSRLMDKDERTAGAFTRLDTRLWHRAAEDWARARGCHTVVETALADPKEFRQASAAFRAAGFRIEVAAMAVPEAMSRLGIVARYLEQAAVHGRGRFVAKSNHDACYRGVPETMAAIEAAQLADNVLVFRRGAVVVAAANRDADGAWTGVRRFADAVTVERSRRWGTTGSLRFCTSLNRIAQQGGPAWHPELRDIARLAAPLVVAGTPLEAAAEGQADASFRAVQACRITSDEGVDSRLTRTAAVVGPGED
ncbi:zeta toxin family protein [Kribbella antibiotica]|nr:zeta toxin family protein [Kribbella antibiotica]